jgi:predicted MFS family arabinose efflux permease
LTTADSQVQMTAFVVLFGFWSGASISLTPVSIAKVSRTEDLGKRTGTAFFVASFGALIGIPIAGAILESQGGDYDRLVVFAGVLYCAAFVSYIVARGISGGWQLNKIW